MLPLITIMLSHMVPWFWAFTDQSHGINLMLGQNQLNVQWWQKMFFITCSIKPNHSSEINWSLLSQTKTYVFLLNVDPQRRKIGTGTHADPWMLERFSGRNTLSRVDSQHAVDEVLGLMSHGVPFRWRILNITTLRLQHKILLRLKNLLACYVCHL